MLASWKFDSERLIRIGEVSTFGLAQIVVGSQMHSSPVYQTLFYCVELDRPGANRDEWPALWRDYGSSRCSCQLTVLTLSWHKNEWSVHYTNTSDRYCIEVICIPLEDIRGLSHSSLACSYPIYVVSTQRNIHYLFSCYLLCVPRFIWLEGIRNIC